MPHIAIIGAGPAGLFAAEHLAALGHQVTIYDQMPSPGRKFLLAGRGGLNLTHAEPLARFLPRYGTATDWLTPLIEALPPERVRAWCEGLGQETFVGSSGRIFPTSFKAAPLLRAWLRRLAHHGVSFAPRHRWLGWGEGGALRFQTQTGEHTLTPNATLLALGGASWPRMGADGAWVATLRQAGVQVTTLRPSNCGVRIAWSPHVAARFAGTPLKRIAATAGELTVRGEAVITATGLEGGAIYPLSAPLRAALDAAPTATITLDLRPDLTPAALAARVDGPRQGQSLANTLRHAGLSPAAAGLVQEQRRAGSQTPLSTLIKSMPLSVTALQGLDRAISSAGGIQLAELTPSLMLHRLPGVFAAGEMLDWEAPTGGYLLQACFATGLRAAEGIASFL
jgi:uncharacterized flavoprotein (TIGR03862 family)